MSEDNLAAPASEGDASAAPAAPPAPSVEEIEKRLATQFEDRFKGLQRVIAEKDQAIRTAQEQILQYQMSGLSEDEKADLERKKVEADFAALKAENELLKLGQEYPEEVPLFQKILSASTPKEQLELLREIRKAQAAQASQAPAETPEEEPELPDVDPNNPPVSARGDAGTVLIDGQPMTEAMADRILNSLSSMPRR